MGPVATYQSLDRGKEDPKGRAPTRVLLVDDDPDDANLTMRDLQAARPYSFTYVRTAGEALALVRDGLFEVCILDYRLPDMSGLALCRRMRQGGFEGPILMLTSVREERVAELAFQAGVNAFMVKDADKTGELARRLASQVDGHAHAA